MMAPEYEKACAMLEPHARFVKVDTEAHQEVGAKHNIRSIPTIAIFKGGKEISRISGARSASELTKWISQFTTIK
jgi:thioredoxin 2